MEPSKQLKVCQSFGHVGPLQVGSYSLVCNHCGVLIAGSLPITVKDLIEKLASRTKNTGEGNAV
jgi:hypothetical protein